MARLFGGGWARGRGRGRGRARGRGRGGCGCRGIAEEGLLRELQRLEGGVGLDVELRMDAPGVLEGGSAQSARDGCAHFIQTALKN